ncbi:hypothetical protein PJWF_00106 [Achromobacter phage JWF]|uniref:hypothetical protein n=1 Tax=Achromobacter phage JWF TaxID=1589748 RepID=UPI000588E490|nr:hypothetical protein AXJ13_gp082 [Achromobacter phage JWF]AJD82999.1 hypothetical protein PJWF_00106 [Achromobacter phage JWF]
MNYKTDVIERASLDETHSALFSKPWLVQHQDGSIEEFDTEEEACARQREIG